jgi:hypothetical protein
MYNYMQFDVNVRVAGSYIANYLRVYLYMTLRCRPKSVNY